MPYSLYCLDFPNNKKYIGITGLAPRQRLAAHQGAAKHRQHQAVHKAIIKYGMPTLRVLCIGEQEYIEDLEKRAIAAFHTQQNRFGYNRSPGGKMLSAEGKSKISALHKGKKLSDKHRANLSHAHKGIGLSPEARAKVSAALRLRPRSPETGAKISAAKKGKPQSPQHIAALSAVRKGVVRGPYRPRKLVRHEDFG